MFEVNLVPDVKAELLKTQKMRNFVIYISILVAAGCVGVILILLSIMGGQGIALANQDNDMKQKSEQILNSDNLNLNLTIQDQLSKLAAIGNERRVLSRIFGILDVILPTGDDEVAISELSINLPNASLSFDGQANSTSEIDYRALEIFKKTVELSYYDFGRYIDHQGNEIPTFCMDEAIGNNVIVGIYRSEKCSGSTSEEADGNTESATCRAFTFSGDVAIADGDLCIVRDMSSKQLQEAQENKQPYFRSECIKDGTNGCLLVAEAVTIRESSNGRNSAGELVLRFSTLVNISQEVFSFDNKHMRVIGPTRQNVTDSYVQVRNMFTEDAQGCAVGDLECINAGGGN